MAMPSFFNPFTATSLDHLHTLVQQRLQQRANQVQKRCKTIPKTEQ